MEEKLKERWRGNGWLEKRMMGVNGEGIIDVVESYREG